MVKRLLISAVTALMAIMVVSANASAQLPFEECNSGASQNTDFCKTVKDNANADTKLFGPDSVLSRVTETVIFVTGSIAVLMLVVGGLRYVLSNGEPAGTASAKNTIIYAVIGLVVALSAEAILRLVLQRL